jgi:hypothetical protein
MEPRNPRVDAQLDIAGVRSEVGPHPVKAILPPWITMWWDRTPRTASVKPALTASSGTLNGAHVLVWPARTCAPGCASERVLGELPQGVVDGGLGLLDAVHR